MKYWACGKQELDVTCEKKVHKMIRHFSPHVVLHTAAFTHVDEAERHSDHAYHVNAIGTRNVAVATECAGAKLVYFSTDYVFGASPKQAYTEYDPPAPLNVYGASKLAGEHYVEQLCKRHFILRTSWLYGEGERHFIGRMLQMAREGRVLRAAVDQLGSPTWTVDLAAFVEQVMHTHAYGVYHGVNQGSCSRYELVRHILLSTGLVDSVKLLPAVAREFPATAQRPTSSVLDDFALRLSGFTRLQPWQHAVQAYLEQHGFGQEGNA